MVIFFDSVLFIINKKELYMKSLKSFLVTESYGAEKWTKKADKFLTSPKMKSALSKFDPTTVEELLSNLSDGLYNFLDGEEGSFDNLEEFKNSYIDELEEMEGFIEEFASWNNIDEKTVKQMMKIVADQLRTVK